jgi:hypothetical protein
MVSGRGRRRAALLAACADRRQAMRRVGVRPPARRPDRRWRVSDASLQGASVCLFCNLAKADKVSGIDPVTGAEVALFNPRTQAWEAHFGWADDQQTIEERTLTGRATIVTLDMNSELRRGARLLWFMMGYYREILCCSSSMARHV